MGPLDLHLPVSVARGELDISTVEHLHRLLEQHHGVPVMTVTRYCEGLRLYARALRETGEDDRPGPFHSSEEALGVAAALEKLDVWSRKSNLLWRLLYMGQPLRTRPCPKHKGRWSGYRWSGYNMGSNDCECQVGLDITGWLP